MAGPGMRINGEQPAAESFAPLVFASVVFHVVMLLGVPLVAKLFWKPKPFTRPRTFQLVEFTPPAPVQRHAAAKPRPEPPPEPPKPKPQPKPAEKPTPAPEPKPAPKPEPKPAEPEPEPPEPEPAPAEEDLSDLDFLDELSASAPTEVTSPTDFPCPWYIRRVRMKVEQHWNPPFNDPDASVGVTFSIFRDGSVSDITITKSSGDATLDNLALRAIKLAEPFPRLLCPQWPKSKLELEWIFNTVKE